jgi:hypothetical protein
VLTTSKSAITHSGAFLTFISCLLPERRTEELLTTSICYHRVRTYTCMVLFLSLPPHFFLHIHSKPQFSSHISAARPPLTQPQPCAASVAPDYCWSPRKPLAEEGPRMTRFCGSEHEISTAHQIAVPSLPSRFIVKRWLHFTYPLELQQPSKYAEINELCTVTQTPNFPPRLSGERAASNLMPIFPRNGGSDRRWWTAHRARSHRGIEHACNTSFEIRNLPIIHLEPGAGNC